MSPTSNQEFSSNLIRIDRRTFLPLSRLLSSLHEGDGFVGGDSDCTMAIWIALMLTYVLGDMIRNFAGDLHRDRSLRPSNKAELILL